nr:cholic acid transport protein p50 {N-terminal} [rats, liver hepatocytes, Sprague-Dawley, Peptide Partial, 15 aa] [Rattus sp.]
MDPVLVLVLTLSALL